MFTRLRHFLLYNNAVPLLLGIFFLSSGAVLAADPDVREQVADATFSEESEVVSVDNSYLLQIDFGSFVPLIKILSVEEDAETYFVSYELSTVDIVEYVWQPITGTHVLDIPKDSLRNEDLSVHVARELKQVVEGQLTHLRDTQEFEKALGKSDKVVATVYRGLVGRFFNEKTETFPGYRPVITPPKVEKPKPPEDENPSPEIPPDDGEPEEPEEPENDTGVAIQLLGPNPYDVEEGGVYEELGALVTVNGTIVEDMLVILGTVDTAIVGTYTVTYTAQNTSLTRSVVVTASSTVPEVETPDTNPPVLTLTGSPAIELFLGEPYSEEGAHAEDAEDGDLTAAIVIEGEVLTDVAGTYTIRYTVSDSAGNSADIERTVVVSEPPSVIEEPTVPPEEVPPAETPVP